MNLNVNQGDALTKSETIKRNLKQAGVTYDDVARLANVTWRMVSYVIHGDRKSAKVMGAIDKLTSRR
jgi:hypothetical protein